MYQEIKQPCAYENKDLRFNPNTPIEFNQKFVAEFCFEEVGAKNMQVRKPLISGSLGAVMHE